MKVVVAHNYHRLGGGSDVVAAATARLLREKGHEVIPFWKDSKDLHGLGGKLRAFACGLYSPSALRELDRLLVEHRPDVLHAHEVYPLLTPWIFRVCQRRGVASVLTCHDYRMTCPAYTHMRSGALCRECLDRGGEWPCVRHNCIGNATQSVAYALRNTVARRFGLYRDADFLATPSEFTRAWLIENAKIPPDRIASVGNPVAMPESRTEYIPEARGYAGFIGRFSPEKGVETLLRAAVRANVPVRLAGDHRDYRPPLESPLIRYEGQLSGAAWETFFAGMRLLVMPSVWFESFGLVAAEAMMRGVPVVCSDLGALSEMVEDGVNGLRFPPGDEGALASALARLWSDGVLLRKLSSNALAKSRQFEPDRYVERLEAAYARAQNRGQSGRFNTIPKPPSHFGFQV